MQQPDLPGGVPVQAMSAASGGSITSFRAEVRFRFEAGVDPALDILQLPAALSPDEDVTRRFAFFHHLLELARGYA